MQVKVFGDILPRKILEIGFKFEEKRVPLVSPQGIFKPQILPEYPLSITTSPESKYPDGFNDDGFLVYSYRGQDVNHKDNASLRKAMKDNVPLIYFHGIVTGRYVAVWPVFIVEDFPQNLSFKVTSDDLNIVKNSLEHNDIVRETGSEAIREYITRGVKYRLHQSGFRERVLHAYREQCSFCKLKHLELLDAAHIIPDSEPEGKPIVQNGIALCKLHHAAFDSNILGVRPDFIVEVRKDVLDEHDGPMLQHGLQELNNRKIILPSQDNLRPDKILLEKRYEEFRTAV